MQVCQSQYKREDVRWRQHLYSVPLPSSSLQITVDPSAASALCHSVGALGLVVACGCSLAPKIDEILSSLLGSAELVCASLEAKNQERAGVWDVVVGMYSPVCNRTGRRQSW